jgi:cystathionine beta-lyase
MGNYRNVESAVIHGGIYGDAATGAVNTPVYQTSTYQQDGMGQHRGWEYSRTGNPTRAALEALIAELESGAAGFAFASGMAAITAVLQLFRPGESIAISSNVYGGTYRVLEQIFKPFGLDYLIADTTDLAAFEASLSDSVKAVLIESPANPLLTVTDIAALAKLTRRRGILLIVDNTFLTPYLQRPLELGADIVVHSATKYLGGHSDLIAGLAVVNTPELAQRLHFIQNATGGILQPFDAFLLIRSIKTLAVRMDRHIANAKTLAALLRSHPAIAKVYYPDTGAMISFELRGGYATEKFFAGLRLIALAESLGGVESLVCHPASMTHASMPKDLRERVGITDGLIRFSVGLEHADDLAADLDQAIEGARMQ